MYKAFRVYVTGPGDRGTCVFLTFTVRAPECLSTGRVKLDTWSSGEQLGTSLLSCDERTRSCVLVHDSSVTSALAMAHLPSRLQNCTCMPEVCPRLTKAASEGACSSATCSFKRLHWRYPYPPTFATGGQEISPECSVVGKEGREDMWAILGLMVQGNLSKDFCWCVVKSA